jgi:hypothetical protein
MVLGDEKSSGDGVAEGERLRMTLCFSSVFFPIFSCIPVFSLCLFPHLLHLEFLSALDLRILPNHRTVAMGAGRDDYYCYYYYLSFNACSPKAMAARDTRPPAVRLSCRLPTSQPCPPPGLPSSIPFPFYIPLFPPSPLRSCLSRTLLE